MIPSRENDRTICTGYTLALKTLFSNRFSPKLAIFRRKKRQTAAFADNCTVFGPARAVWTDQLSPGSFSGEKNVSRVAFKTTQSELHAIASAPIAGKSLQPKSG